MGDWIKLHRLLLSWEWFTTPNMVHFWIYCLIKASHRDVSWKGKKIGKGQFISGRFVMSAETGLSERSIRTCIERLKSTNEMTSQSTNEYTIFTINSWNKYQLNEPCDQPIDQRTTSQRPASDHIQEGKEVKKVKKNTNTVVSVPETLAIIPGFVLAWEKWLEHLRQKRKPPTSLAMAGQLKKLESSPDPIKAINHSIENNWQGIFEPRPQANQKPDFVSEIKRCDALMREKYGIEAAGQDHPRATQSMLCSAPHIPETGDFECGDSDNWERMHGDPD